MTIQALINKIFRANQTQNNTVSWSGSNGLKSIQEDIVDTIRQRTFFTVPSTVDLTNQGFGNAVLCYVQDNAFYRWEPSGIPNGTTIFPANDGGVWVQETIGDTDGTVTSIGITAPAAFTVTNSPVTTSGVIDIAANGTSAQYIDGTGALQTLPTSVSTVKHQVKAGVPINKGQAVYVTSADGTNMIVGLASNLSEATSSKTMGLLDATVATNGFANVVTEGLLAGLDTSAANAAGDPVWLGQNGNLIFGLVNKPYAPLNLVYLGVVTRKNVNNGEIFISVQNGFELDELHNVDAKNPNNNDGIFFNSTTNLWEHQQISTVIGGSPVTGSGTTNYLPKWTSGSALGNSSIFNNGNNVGIGTTSPGYPLEVTGTAPAVNSIAMFSATSALDGLGIFNSAASNPQPSLRFFHNTSSYRIWLYGAGNLALVNTWSGGTPLYNFFGSGNFGIGVGFTDAGYKLDVLGTARIQNTLTVSNPSYSGGGSFYQAANFTTVIAGGPASENITFGPSNRIFLNASQVRIPSGSLQIASTLSVGTTNTSSLNMIWATGSITAGFNIARGIFTDTTLVASANNDVLVGLDVAPTFTNGAFTGVSNLGLRVQADALITKSSGNATLTVQSASTSNSSFVVTSGTTNVAFYNRSTTNVGNMSLPANSAELNVFGKSAFGIVMNGPTYFAIGQQTTGEQLRLVASTGNFLINTTTDAGYKLDVNGTGRVQTSFTIGGASDGTLYFPNTTSGHQIRIFSQFASNALVLYANGYNLQLNGAGGMTTSFCTTITGSNGSTALVVQQGNAAWTPVAKFNAIGSTGTQFNTNGNVLIGSTTDNGYKLDVNGTARIIGLTTLSSGLLVSSYGSTIAGGQSISGSGSGNFDFNNGSGGGWYFNWTQNGSTAMRLSTGNNLLIGTTTDAGYKLDVNGTTRLRSDAVFGIGNGLMILGKNTGGAQSQSMIQFDGASGWNFAITNFAGSAYLDLTNDGKFTMGNNVIYTSRDNSAVLNLVSTTRGFLKPRMTTTQRNAIATPATGLEVYNTTTNTEDYYNGTTWVSLQSSITNPVTGTGTTNYIPKWSSSSALGNSVMYDDGTNIGIGTTTPSYKLDVNGTARATTVITDTITTTGSTTLAGYSGSTYTYGPLTANQSTYTFTFGFFNVLYGNITSGYVPKANTIGMGDSAIYNSGSNNVLIGTTTDAGYKLDVNGTTRINTTGNALTINDSSNSRNFTFNPSYATSVYGGSINHSTGHITLVASLGTDNGSSVGIFLGGPSGNRNASALLQMDSTSKGFLPPRMTNAQRTAIATPAVGLIVYCTDATEGLYIYKSTGWTFVI